MRDEFSAKTKRLLAARVGYHCSNPDCVSSTSGPALDEEGTVNIGVGAHITAAASGGPRYVANMTPTERSSSANGIWLCQSCSKLIDSDIDRYTAELLYEWKKDAIQRAVDAIASGRPLGTLRASSTFDDADEEFLRGLNLPSSDAVEKVGARLRVASQADIGAFRAQRNSPVRMIALTFRLENTINSKLTLKQVACLAELAEPVSIVAPGGTGKSTTVVQIADLMLSENGPVPLLVPLGEWSDRTDDFFDFILRRQAYGSFRRQHLMQLAYHGRLLLLLDGWNELTPEARLRATNDVTAHQRDYPQLSLIICTRRQALPTAGPIVGIESLSQDQQLELAQAVRGQDGIDILDRAWRTAGVRELVGIPLYLNALLLLPASASFPETKEAVLRMFVEQSESSPDRIERLQRDTLGQHTPLLISLAVEANGNANTVISDSDANRTVSIALQQLSEDGQIGAVPQPRDVVDGMVGAHLLVRSAGPNGAVSFQHQLFQEWYAATEVEGLMLDAAAGDSDARQRLRKEILDWPNWEESILFACDRLSRADEVGAQAVAGTIVDALGIDPILAAAMLDRAAEAVWLSLREEVQKFVERWHVDGTIDRAVRFMVQSGKPEFESYVWPLAASTDNQIQFAFFRIAEPFRPGVLGHDCETRIRDLPTLQRKHALSEIAYNSGFDGMELATNLAMKDPAKEVVVAVVESLAFRRADQHVNRIMRCASDAVWKLLAQKGDADYFSDPELNARLAAEHAKAFVEETEPSRLIARILSEKPSDAEDRIKELLATADIDFNNDGSRLIAHMHSQYPGAVASGLLARISTDLPMPYRSSDYLKDAALTDSGPIAEAALDESTDERRLEMIAAVIGPKTVSLLFDQLFDVDDRARVLGRYDKQLSTMSRRLTQAIAATRQDIFLEVLATRAQTDNPNHIGLMAELIGRHGSPSDTRRPIDVANREQLRDIVEDWISTLLRSPNPARYQSSRVAFAAERLADASLADPLHRLLERDLTDKTTAKASLSSAPRGDTTLDTTGYSRLYARAFSAMHDAPAVEVLKQGLSDLRWGTDAAGALFEIWSVARTSEEKRIFGGWTDYSQHLSRRAERSAGTPETSDFAEAIFDVVRGLGKPAMSDTEQQHALALSAIALAMPHGSKRQEIDDLLALPQPIRSKRRLLAAAARAGETIPATILIDGLQDLLEAAEEEAWRLDENRGELMGWVDLFPFSDSPAIVHEAITLLPEQHRQPHALRRLLQTLPQSPPASALATLERLAADNSGFLQEFEWTDALIKIDTEDAALFLLNQLCSGNLRTRDGYSLSRVLTKQALKYPAVRTAMIACYGQSPAGNVRSTLENAMEDLTDEDIFMALFEGQVDAPNAIRRLRNALRNLAFGREPSVEWPGAYQEFGKSLRSLRARLFAMLPTNDARANLAKQCLVTIDEFRDDGGHVSDEPRHPDINTGRSWPEAADAEKADDH